MVSANSEKIAAEELQCKAMAENAQRDLNEALPALEEAMKVKVYPVGLIQSSLHQYETDGCLLFCVYAFSVSPSCHTYCRLWSH